MSKKHSSTFKKQVVLEYLEGNIGFGSLAKKYGISGESPIKEWVRKYQTDGAVGLNRAMSHNKYTAEFKLRVLMHRQQHELSYAETASFFGLSNFATIAGWQSRYDKYGMLGLERKPRGKPMKEHPPQTI